MIMRWVLDSSKTIPQTAPVATLGSSTHPHTHSQNDISSGYPSSGSCIDTLRLGHFVASGVRTPAPLLVSTRGSLPNLPTQLIDLELLEPKAQFLMQIPILDFVTVNPFAKLHGVDLLKQFNAAGAADKQGTQRVQGEGETEQGWYVDIQGDKNARRDGQGHDIVAIKKYANIPKQVPVVLSTRAAGSTDFCYPSTTMLAVPVPLQTALVQTTTNNSVDPVLTGYLRSLSNQVKVSVENVLDLQEQLAADIIEVPSEPVGLIPHVNDDDKRHLFGSERNWRKYTEKSRMRSDAMIDVFHQVVGAFPKAAITPRLYPIPASSFLFNAPSTPHVLPPALTLSPAQLDFAAGYILTGLGVGESPRQRVTTIRKIIALLADTDAKFSTRDHARFLSAAGGDPEEVLDAVAAGVDVIESSYPFEAAEAGYALNLRNATKWNVRDSKWKTDRRNWTCSSPQPHWDHTPCGCGACTKGFTRAYTHHLFNVHEMLGETLLSIHNLWDYLQFFSDIRKNIELGSFHKFRNRFRSFQHESHCANDDF